MGRPSALQKVVADMLWMVYERDDGLVDRADQYFAPVGAMASAGE